MLSQLLFDIDPSLFLPHSCLPDIEHLKNISKVVDIVNICSRDNFTFLQYNYRGSSSSASSCSADFSAVRI